MACPELSFKLFGGFTGLEDNIGCQILGGSAPQSEYWGVGGGGGAGAPPAPMPLQRSR